jgi:hypothetical protein
MRSAVVSQILSDRAGVPAVNGVGCPGTFLRGRGRGYRARRGYWRATQVESAAELSLGLSHEGLWKQTVPEMKGKVVVSATYTGDESCQCCTGQR